MKREVITLDRQLLGAFIAGNRKHQGLTQQQLAQTLHVTDKAVSKWERGLSYPDVTLLEPLAAALGLTVGELVCCTAPAEKKEQHMEHNQHQPEHDALHAVVELASSNQKRRQRQWLTGAGAAIVTLLVVAALLVIQSARINAQNPYRYTEVTDGLIQQVERTGESTFLYVMENGDTLSPELLKLTCPPDMDTSDLKCGWRYVNGTLAHPRYVIWYDRRTSQVTRCDPVEEYLTVPVVGDFDGAAAQPMEQPLFGFEETYTAHLDGLGSTYFFAPMPEQPAERQVLMVLPDSYRQVDYRVEDTDGDGDNELLLTNLGGDMPYMLCDADPDGHLTTQLFQTWG